MIAPSGQDLVRYDFESPPAPSLKSDGAIESLHAEMAAGLSARLSDHLRSDVLIAFSFVEAIRYDDFLHSLDETTCLGVIAVDPPGAQACLDLELAIVFPMIDRLLGGDSASATRFPTRPLTQIEQGLALQIVERATSEMAGVWSRVIGYTVALREQTLESDPK